VSAPDLNIPEIDALLEALVSRQLSVEETDRLESLLVADESARDYYRRFVSLHVMLEAWSKQTAPALLPSVGALEMCDHELGTVAPFLSKAPVGRRRISPVWLPVAAMILLFAYFIGLPALIGLDRAWRLGVIATPTPRTVIDASNTSGEPAALQTVATLTNGDNCQWQVGDETVRLRNGTRLLANDALNLTTGTAEITFADGAAVVLEGPATFTVEDAGRGKLARGKLVAKVPRRAVGFTVATPTATVVDLGTEFGVTVDAAGATGVSVFRGAVTARPTWSTTEATEHRPLTLTADQAVRFDLENHRIEQDQPHDSQLVALRNRTRAPKCSLPVISYLFDDNIAPQFSRVKGTLEGAAGPQADGPIFSDVVPRKYPGNKSLRFDGVDDIVSLGTQSVGQAIEGTAAVSFCAWVCFETDGLQGDKHDNVIFLSRMGASNEGASGIWANVRNDGEDAGKVLIGGRSQAGEDFCEATHPTPLTPDQWHLIVGILDYAYGKIGISINGEAPRFADVQFASPMYVNEAMISPIADSISRQGGTEQSTWKGHIDEVAIFKTALTEDEIKFLFEHGLGSVAEPLPD
jgi:hypothetical protein